MSNLAIVVGTRPEIIKMSPVIRKLRDRGSEFSFILTGQHYDYDMSLKFVEELGLPLPNSAFRLENSTPATQIGEMMSKLDRVLDGAHSRLLVMQGDTNSMLAAALTGVKMGIRIAHVEAGLRSYDWRMPEEHNRRMVDHVSDILFAPTQISRENLMNENVHGRVLVTGNTVVDAVNLYLPLALKNSNILTQIPFREFCLTTIHRKENVDSPQVLRSLVNALAALDDPLVFPLHPRTAMRLQEFNLYEKLSRSPHVCLLPAVGYFDTLVLMKECRFILTDSGGLQEEATVPSIKKPVVVVRASTERPEAIQAGFAKLAGVNEESIHKAVKSILDEPPSLPDFSPFGDGDSAHRIVSVLSDELESDEK